MQQNSTQLTLEAVADQLVPADKGGYVVGLDVGDDFSYVCLLDRASGEVAEETRLRTTPEALRRYFAKLEPARIALETGTHSPWMSRLLGNQRGGRHSRLGVDL